MSTSQNNVSTPTLLATATQYNVEVGVDGVDDLTFELRSSKFELNFEVRARD